MNFNKDLYKNAEAKEFGEFENLELGGHEIVILDAREYTSDFSGNTSLKVSIDIAGNDKQAGFFKKQYDEAMKNKKEGEEVKWPTGATRYLSLKDEQLPYLKGFITAVENSNKGFKFNPDGNWDQLKNLKLAGVFGLEQYENNDGEIKTATKLTNFRSLDKLSEIKIPRVKLLNGNYVEYDTYKNQSANTAEEIFGSDAVEISDDQLPF